MPIRRHAGVGISVSYQVYWKSK